MKEILQTKYLNLKSTFVCASAHLHVPAFPLHVENVDQEYVTVEEEPEAEEQEELQELEVVDPAEEQDPSDFTNPDQQPGKHRKHSNPVSYLYLKF
jgi:hypothetical protein